MLLYSVIGEFCMGEGSCCSVYYVRTAQCLQHGLDDLEAATPKYEAALTSYADVMKHCSQRKHRVMRRHFRHNGINHSRQRLVPAALKQRCVQCSG
jgi:hypothetical protein